MHETGIVGETMRTIAAWVLAAAILFGGSALKAEEACTTPDALGVSRTIEVDTTGGPGSASRTGTPDFLAARRGGADLR
jgi:hypothetical protein